MKTTIAMLAIAVLGLSLSIVTHSPMVTLIVWGTSVVVAALWFVAYWIKLRRSR